MPIDSSLYSQFAPRVRSVSDIENDLAQGDATMLQNGLARQKMQEYTAGVQRQGQIRNALLALQPDATDQDRIRTLRNTATPEGFEQADKLETAVQTRQKSAADTNLANAHADEFRQSTTGKALETYRGLLPMIRTPQQFATWVDGMYANPATAEVAKRFGSPEDVKSRIPSDPTQFQQFVQMNAVGMQHFMTDQTNRRGQDITAQTSRDNNAATVGATIRGQNMVDARAREAAGGIDYKQDADGNWVALPKKPTDGQPITATPVVGPDGKPLASAGKPLTETQGKATGFAARMQDAEGTIQKLEKVGVSGADLRTIAAGNAYTNFLASPQGQQYRQAQENWVTANLRQESGAAIGKDEMAKDVRKFFPSPGDAPEVIAQKAQARQVASRGMLAQAGPGAKQVAGIVGKPTSGAVNFSDLK